MLHKGTKDDWPKVQTIINHPRNKKWCGSEWSRFFDPEAKIYLNDDGVVMLAPELGSIYSAHIAFLPKTKNVHGMLMDVIERLEGISLMVAIPEDNIVTKRLAIKCGFDFVTQTQACYGREEESLKLNVYRRI